MAFNITSQARKVLDVIGVATRSEYGVIALSGGTATVNTSMDVVEVAFVSSQTSNAARVSATSNNSFTITGTGTDVVMWWAIGKGGR